MSRVSADTKQATRTKLLAAAADEFGRVGFERASVDAISLAAGYSKGTIYNYFPSKEALFLAVVEEATAQAIESARRLRASARERLTATLAGFCAWARQNESLARVLVRECLMGTPGLYTEVIRAEEPLLGELRGDHSGGSRPRRPARRCRTGDARARDRGAHRPGSRRTLGVGRCEADARRHPRARARPSAGPRARQRPAHNAIAADSFRGAGLVRQFGKRPGRARRTGPLRGSTRRKIAHAGLEEAAEWLS